MATWSAVADRDQATQEEQCPGRCHGSGYQKEHSGDFRSHKRDGSVPDTSSGESLA